MGQQLEYVVKTATTSLVPKLAPYSHIPGGVGGAHGTGNVKLSVRPDPKVKFGWILVAAWEIGVAETSPNNTKKHTGMAQSWSGQQVTEVAKFTLDAKELKLKGGDTDTLDVLETNWTDRSISVEPDSNKPKDGVSANGVVKKWGISQTVPSATITLYDEYRVLVTPR